MSPPLVAIIGSRPALCSTALVVSKLWLYALLFHPSIASAKSTLALCAAFPSMCSVNGTALSLNPFGRYKVNGTSVAQTCMITDTGSFSSLLENVADVLTGTSVIVAPPGAAASFWSSIVNLLCCRMNSSSLVSGPCEATGPSQGVTCYNGACSSTDSINA